MALRKPASLQRPSARQLRIAEHARHVRVFTYDISVTGIQPPLNATDPTAQACKCRPLTVNTGAVMAGFPSDYCNFGLGKLHRRRFMSMYQVCTLTHAMWLQCTCAVQSVQ